MLITKGSASTIDFKVMGKCMICQIWTYCLISTLKKDKQILNHHSIDDSKCDHQLIFDIIIIVLKLTAMAIYFILHLLLTYWEGEGGGVVGVVVLDAGRNTNPNINHSHKVNSPNRTNRRVKNLCSRLLYRIDSVHTDNYYGILQH